MICFYLAAAVFAVYWLMRRLFRRIETVDEEMKRY